MHIGCLIYTTNHNRIVLGIIVHDISDSHANRNCNGNPFGHKNLDFEHFIVLVAYLVSKRRVIAFCLYYYFINTNKLCHKTQHKRHTFPITSNAFLFISFDCFFFFNLKCKSINSSAWGLMAYRVVLFACQTHSFPHDLKIFDNQYDNVTFFQ